MMASTMTARTLFGTRSRRATPRQTCHIQKRQEHRIAGRRDETKPGPLPPRPQRGLHVLAQVASDGLDELKVLKQEKESRAGKYRSKVAGTETPEWNRARVVARRDLLPKLREIILEVETSRELISLRNSYCAVGKTAQIKVKGSEPVVLVPSCAPFPAEEQHDALLRLRGDLKAGQTKLPEDPIKVKNLLTLLVTPDDGEAYDVQVEEEGTEEEKLAVELGPFLGNGMNLRGAIQHLYNYPTILICAEGQGIGTAKALIENVHRGSLDLKYRDDIRLYYKVPNEDSVCYDNLFELWEQEYGVKTIVHTSSFLDAFDDDDTLEYEPTSTAVISLGTEETEQMAVELCEEAEVKLHIKSSVEQQEMHYADTGKVV